MLHKNDEINKRHNAGECWRGTWNTNMLEWGTTLMNVKERHETQMIMEQVSRLLLGL